MDDLESQNSQNAGQFQQQLGMSEKQFSPFRPPTDEEVFITRETEKQKRKEAKEKAKNLKIWDKKTATTKVPLKKIKDADILPAVMDESLYNFNSNQRGLISTAVHVAKSRVQFPREQRPQNIQEFIDQKKEMFLVDLSYNTVKKEIDSLDRTSQMKKTALEESKKQLETDYNKLMHYIEQDEKQTQSEVRKADDKQNERKRTEMNLKDKEQKILNIKSEIDKNKDSLASLEQHKKFLLKVFSINDHEWVEKQQQKKEELLAQIQKEWIRQHKFDKADDKIIFRADDDLYVDTTRRQGNSSSGQDNQANQRFRAAGRRDTQSNDPRAQMTDKLWEEKFKILMKEDLIEVPKAYYQEELLFDDPGQLNAIFSEKENKNLFLIKKTQEIEGYLEMEKDKESKLRQKRQEDYDVQKRALEDLQNQKIEALKGLEELRRKSKLMGSVQQTSTKKDGQSQDQEDNYDIDELLGELRKAIIRVYKNAIDQNADLTAKGTVDILTDIELQLEDKMKQIKQIESIGREEEQKVTKAERDQFQQFIQKKIDTQQLENQKKIENDKAEQIKKMNKIIPKKTRPAIPRSKKKMVKKEEVKQVIDQEQMDMNNYLGDLTQVEQ